MNTLFGPDPMDYAAEAYVRWVKACCRTIEEARRSRPGRAGPGCRAQIGGYDDSSLLKPDDVLIQLGEVKQVFSLKAVWKRCGVVKEYGEPWEMESDGSL